MGACYGAWDVAMNIQGSYVERAADRPWMSRYHACWSVGSIVGAGVGALAAWAGMGVTLHFALVATLIAIGVLVALRTLRRRARARTARRRPRDCRPVRQPTARPAGTHHPVRHLHRGRRRRLAGPAHRRRPRRDRRGRGCRLRGLRDRDDRRPLRRTPDPHPVGPGADAAPGRRPSSGAGVLLAALAPAVPLALLGGAVWGLGIALVFPSAMSAGGETPGRSAAGIATVATIGYGGFLLGPPLLGLLGHQIGLGNALLCLVVLAVGIVALAPAAKPVSA